MSLARPIPRLTPVTIITGAGMIASSSQASSLPGGQLLRSPRARASNLRLHALLNLGTCRSLQILLEQIERRREKNHVLHEESHVALHRREAGGGVPAVRHERDNGD